MSDLEDKNQNGKIIAVYNHSGAVLHCFIVIIAIAIALSCSEKKFDILEILVACCCPYIYIVYKLLIMRRCTYEG